jgi:hypothetical protein
MWKTEATSLEETGRPRKRVGGIELMDTKNEDGRPEHAHTTRHGALLTGKGDSQVDPDERRQGDGMRDRSHQKDPNPG